MSAKTDGKAITFEEVEKHNKKDDCWMIIHGKVYDVTKFLVEHPGGEEVMLESKGFRHSKFCNLVINSILYLEPWTP